MVERLDVVVPQSSLYSSAECYFYCPILHNFTVEVVQIATKSNVTVDARQLLIGWFYGERDSKRGRAHSPAVYIVS